MIRSKKIGKNLINVLQALVLTLMLSFCNINFALADNLIRELDSDFFDIDRNILGQQDYIYNSGDIVKKSPKFTQNKEVINAPILKGGITELRAVVGKSQIIRFDEPVKRISITKPDLVDMIFLSPQEVIMNGKIGGETTVIIWGEGKDPVFFNLFVENNNLNFIKEVKKIAPNEPIDIDFVDTGGDSGLKVMLKGKISSSIIKNKIETLAEAYGYSIIDLTETLEPQVMLEVKIVEMGKTKGKGRGAEFKKGLFQYLEHTEKLSGFDFKAKDAEGKLVDDPWIVDAAIEAMTDGLTLPNVGNEFDGVLSGTGFDKESGFSFWKAFPDKNLSFQLTAAESEGLVKILSEPRVMVINGNKANFTSGSEVPVPAGVDELGNIQYEYVDVGTTIEITPTILEESERIVLEIKAEISEIDKAISTTAGPGFNTRESETKVEVADSHTTVITGLVRKSQTKTVTKFPYLSNLPLIGKFFNNITSSNDDTELMIFVTASIVKPSLERGEL